LKKLLIAVALVSASATANSQEFETGNSLYAKLMGDSIDRMVGMSYIAGVHDAYASITICSPDTITKGQLSDMMRNWLGNNPAHRHLPASVLVNRAFSNVWPCKNNRQGQGT
jgi:hypothetical protein